MIISAPSDFRKAARRRLPPFLFEYADGGANTEQTSKRNVSDLVEIELKQRVLTGVGDVVLRSTLFGTHQDLPVVLGPVGIAGMFRRRGEVQAARACAAFNIPFTLSTVSLCSLSEVVGGAGRQNVWFQLYVIRDRAFMRDALQTAKELGVRVLLFTVDMPIPGARYRDARSGMSGPRAPLRRFFQTLIHPRWAWDVGLMGRPHHLGNLVPVLGKDSGLKDYMGWLTTNFDPTIRWEDLDFIRSEWPGTLVIKGILDPTDARAAADLGADGIVVSNHGGRQLDGVLSSIRALPPIVDRVGDRLTVLADSGVRSGLDVLRMLASGARGVLLGRAWVYALAAGGEAGVRQLLEIMAHELRIAMTLSGAANVSALGPTHLARPVCS